MAAMERHLAHPMFTFAHVPYAPGILKAIGYIGGKPAAVNTVRTPEAPKSLTLAFDTARNPFVADGADAVFVRAEIVDANGTTVPRNTLPSLHFSVDGPARLVGADPIHIEAGVASMLLQSTGGTGPVRVTATATGLASATATVTPQPAPGPVPRTPGVLPAPVVRPDANHYTKLTGTVIGTPGAFKGDDTGITKAFDGDTATFVDAAESTGGSGCWLGLDLGTPKTITRLRFFPRLEWTGRMSGGKFQGSDTPDFSKDVVDLFDDCRSADGRPVDGGDGHRHRAALPLCPLPVPRRRLEQRRRNGV